jgi:hypothetical protein
VIDDDTLLAVLAADEAMNQPHEGRVLPPLIALTRAEMRYASDGTIAGTVLHRWAFSGFWAQMEHGRYVQCAFDLAGAEQRARALLTQFQAEAGWADCVRAVADARAWQAGRPMSFEPGPQFRRLTPRCALYFNPKIVRPPPAWATPDKHVADIFDEQVFEA